MTFPRCFFATLLGLVPEWCLQNLHAPRSEWLKGGDWLGIDSASLAAYEEWERQERNEFIVPYGL
jgi:hypothetical protein